MKRNLRLGVVFIIGVLLGNVSCQANSTGRDSSSEGAIVRVNAIDWMRRQDQRKQQGLPQETPSSEIQQWLEEQRKQGKTMKAEKENAYDFEADKIGEHPKNFTNEGGEWKIISDNSAPSGLNVLAQLAVNPGSVFNVTLVSNISCKDADISVMMKSVAGNEDRGGGLVWRAKDVNNYYIARYNPLENNYRVYKIVGGRRSMLQNAVVKHSNGWHTLRVVMSGNNITCFYDGQQYLKVTDETFDESGKVGLWTKADAQTYFNDLTIRGK